MLSPGVRLGPYEIVGSLGAGGMGEVYRATDTKLKRQVAIKVLPASLAADAERLARFQREAEVLASLNHPNIAAIHGLEEADGIKALVMELVEGPTLADGIEQGAIPVDEALPIARQIAEALEAAHEQGIVHRDLKPANIKVRSDGTVKVLDFGLAKAMEPVGALSTSASIAPTITSPALMTGAGVILGTAAYMSPEQARGRVVDKRADIWAFGAVLFEMLTGTRAFRGDDIPDTLANVLKVEPAWDVLPSGLSPTLIVYIKRCLYKDPRQRVGDMRDMRLVLEGAFETDVSPNAATANAQPIGRRLLPFAAGVVLAGAVAALVAWSLWPSAEPRPVTRFAYDIPAGTEGWASRSMIAVAPDGRTAVVSTSNGLYIQAMDALEGRLIPGTSGFTAGLFFSVDGKWIGYWDANARALMRISLSGGPPILIAASAGPYGSSWSADGTILFAVAEGIMRIASTGGMPDLVIKANDGERIDGPGLLPDGESVLFSVTTATGDTRWDQAKIVVQSLRTGARTVVLEGGSDARYLRTGHLVYARGTTLFAVPFDVGRLSVTGSAVPVAEGLSRADRPVVDTATANYGVSDDGTLVYATRGSYADQRLLVWVDRQGREEPLPAPPRPYVYPRISPDGARIALRIRDQQRDIWTWDLARETLTRLTFTSGEELYAIWTPDSRRLLFDSSGDNERQSQNVFWQAADGTGAAERLTDSRDRPRPFAISPDGNRVVLRVGVTPPYDLGVLLLGNPRRTEPLLTTPFNETNAEVSPDGRWLAYDSNESGRSEVYVRPFPNVDGGRWQVSRDGGTRPVWARDGRDLFYLVRDGADAVFMSVRVESGQTWTTGTVTRLFAGRYFADDAFGGPGQGRTYDVGADGRFLMLRDASPSESAGPTTRLIVVQHWDEELKRLVPTN